MRRKEKEITDIQEIENILNSADICRLAFCDNQMPYIVPMSFAYSNRCLYFHSAKEGRKLDIINKNPNVCFEVETDTALIYDEAACKCTMKYKSVIGTGKVIFIEEEVAKIEALDLLMKHYVDKDEFTYPQKAIQAVAIFKVEINEMSGKKSGY